MKYLLDTGVLLRLFDRQDEFQEVIASSLRGLIANHILVTTVQNLAEFWNVSTRPVTARGGYGHSPGEAERRVQVIERMCGVLTESVDSYQNWRKLVLHHSLVGVSVHDARLVSVMNAHEITEVVTLNPGDFRRYESIHAVTPEELSGLSVA